MAGGRPLNKFDRRICIICEGYEEHEYLDRLIRIGVFHKGYEIILINAKAQSNIPSRYQDRFMSDSYNIVLVFCDTDKAPYEGYEEVRKKINEVHGDDVSDLIMIYANPCSMQLILAHFSDEVKLVKPGKSLNEAQIEALTGISNYQAHEDQRKRIFAQLSYTNFTSMKDRISILNEDYHTVPSSNFIKLLTWLQNDDYSWISEINRILDKC